MTEQEATHYRSCPLCEASCGLELTVRDGKVIRIRGDRDDGFSKGFVCPKGASLHHLHADPDRLRTPWVRRGEDPDTASWDEVSWTEAFEEIERRLIPVLERHGRDAAALYLGNPNVHNLAGSLYVRPLAKALGTRNIMSASTVDQMPKHVSSGLLFGNPNAIPVPDLDRTDFLLMLGANPWESNGSLCTAPDFPGRLRAIRARGGRFVVVDPRRTRTAEHADEHVPIRPGTDSYFLLGLLHVIFSEGLVRLGRLAPHVRGLERLRALLGPFAAEPVARRSGVPADTLRRLARELASTERAVAYGRIGTHTVETGTVAAWAVDALNIATRHLDEPGGAMWALPAHQRQGAGRGRGFQVGRYRSRVRGYPEVRGEFPAVTLADEIETPGEGQVRAFLTVAGNPVLSTPDGRRLERALRKLDFMVSVDPYRNETTRYAHVILPPPSPLMRSHYELAFFGLAVRNVAKWSPPLFADDAPSEADILARLAAIAGGHGAAADPALVHQLVEQAVLRSVLKGNEQLEGRNAEELRETLEADVPVDRCVEILVRSGAYGDQFGQRPEGLNLTVLRDNPHGVDLGPLRPRVPELLQTTSGAIELVAPLIEDALVELASTLEESAHAGPVLIGRRDIRSNNSWMHNVPLLVRGRERCTLQLHPEDAARLGLENGHTARITSRVGEVKAPIEITDGIMPGVVSLPHGWGHHAPNVQLGVAAAHAGVNSNELSDPERVDPLSGNAVLNGIPVTLSS